MIQPNKGFVSVTVDSYRATRLLQNLQFKMPKVGKEIQKEFGDSLVRRLRRQLTTQQLIDTKTLYNRIKWTQMKDNGYLSMPLYGEFLDRGKPRWVKFKRTRQRFINWGLRKGNLGVKVAAMTQGSIFVKPHPWIDVPLLRTIRNLPKISERVLDRNIKEAKA